MRKLYVISTTVANICVREQLQNARDNPLAAAAAAAVSGTVPPSQVQNNAENLLDIDFDGTAPASAQKEPPIGMSGLEGLAGTPMRVASPPTFGAPTPTNNLEDLMGVFGTGGGDSAYGTNEGSTADVDILNGFAGLDLSGSTSPPATTQSAVPKKNNQDILDLF